MALIITSTVTDSIRFTMLDSELHAIHFISTSSQRTLLTVDCALVLKLKILITICSLAVVSNICVLLFNNLKHEVLNTIQIMYEVQLSYSNVNGIQIYISLMNFF